MFEPFADCGRLPVYCKFHAEEIVIQFEDLAGEFAGLDDCLAVRDLWVLDADVK